MKRKQVAMEKNVIRRRQINSKRIRRGFGLIRYWCGGRVERDCEGEFMRRRGGS
jgi:hypothetical protein